ncbi:hypothetical protein [Streptomyces sp. x-19]|uniref:hypothetical protein n=1 Tax=Streptomyces sp. x-19 TaxID=2789280 RepID=UPI0039802F86
MPLGSRPKPGPKLRELKETVRTLLGLDDDTAVVVRQLTCTEPGCPPLETVIAVLPMDAPARRWTLHHPAEQITDEHLKTTLLAAPHETAYEGACE